MSWRGVTLQTRAASAADRRSREMTSPSIGSGASSFAPRTASETAASQPRVEDPTASAMRTAVGFAPTRLGRVALEAVLLDLGIEEPTIDPEHLGRLRSIARRVAQR